MYSLIVVAADHAHFAAGEAGLEDVGRVGRRADRRAGAHERVRFVHEQDQVRVLLDLLDHRVDPLLEHAPQHGARHHRVHLQVDDVAVPQPARYGFGLELDAPREPFDDRRLADTGLADQHHGVRALAVAQDLQHLLDLAVAADDGRDLVLPRQQVQVHGEVLEGRGQLEALAQLLLAQLAVTEVRGDTRHQGVGLDPVAADDHHRGFLALVQDAGHQVGRLDGLPARAAGMVKRGTQHELRGVRRSQLGSFFSYGRLSLNRILDGLQHFVRVQIQIPHRLREGVPLHASERKKQVRAGELRVAAPPRFVHCSIDNTLSRFTDPVLCDVQVVHHRGLLAAPGRGCLILYIGKWRARSPKGVAWGVSGRIAPPLSLSVTRSRRSSGPAGFLGRPGGFRRHPIMGACGASGLRLRWQFRSARRPRRRRRNRSRVGSRRLLLPSLPRLARNLPRPFRRPHRLRRPFRRQRQPLSRPRSRWACPCIPRRSTSPRTTPDAARRYVLFGTTAAFAEIVTYYRAQLMDGGDQVFREPLTHTFDVGRFREETMVFPPGVTVKDWTWGGSKGYPNPRPNGQPARFPTVIMLVPQPPAAQGPR